MIAAVRDDVQEHFFTTHETRISVGENKGHLFLERRAWQVADVGEEPSVDLFRRRRESMQGWRFLRVRGRVTVSTAREVGFEDAVDDIDVIQDSIAVLASAGCFSAATLARAANSSSFAHAL